ncbi:MAG: RnfABCDGE type electron transport complex subunit G [Eubacteriales bacterium]|nr:RnfABCDGE type electron transport complex subunit G [Eubacteriales bacterium]
MLLAITLISGLALGGAYQLTKGRIAEQELAAEAAAYAAVAPDAASFGAAEELETRMTELTAEDGTVADGQFGKVVYDSAYAALDESGSVIGHVVNVTTKEGFGGEISISTGIALDGTVTGVAFLTINETAGLGMRATEPEFYEQFVGKNVESYELTKSAASADNQIEALSGASVTSNAVTNAMNAALYLVQSAEG